MHKGIVWVRWLKIIPILWYQSWYTLCSYHVSITTIRGCWVSYVFFLFNADHFYWWVMLCVGVGIEVKTHLCFFGLCRHNCSFVIISFSFIFLNLKILCKLGCKIVYKHNCLSEEISKWNGMAYSIEYFFKSIDNKYKINSM